MLKSLTLTILVLLLLVGVNSKVDNRLVLTNKTQGQKQMATNALGGSTSGLSSISSYPASLYYDSGTNSVQQLSPYGTNTISTAPAPAGQTTPGGGGGGGGWGDNTTTNNQQTQQNQYVDPLSAAQHALQNGYTAQADNVYSSAQAAADAFGQKYGRDVSDFLTNQQIGQSGLDTQGQKNQLAKMQGQKGILSMVGQGINSGGVQLANRNAGDSSGAEAIARAYGQLGNQQMADVNNQYELGNVDLQNSQDTFNLDQQMKLGQLQGSKQDSINTIVNDARTKLATIDAQIAGASLPDRIQLDQARQRVQNGAVQALQAYDSQLTNGVSAIKPMGQDETRAKAAGMASAGYDLGNQAFNYTTEAPAQFQNTGPSTSALPVYSNQYGKKQTA